MLFPVGDLANNFSPNPMVRRHGRGPAGAHCKTCRYIVYLTPNGNRTYIKCQRRSVSRSDRTDHRLKWDACRLYEKEIA